VSTPPHKRWRGGNESTRGVRTATSGPAGRPAKRAAIGGPRRRCSIGCIGEISAVD